MSKFDLSLKIKSADLIREIFNQQKLDPFLLLKKKLKLDSKWQANYFNWGRNAFYYLFKSLPFKSITFPAFTCPTLTEAAEKAGKKVILTEIDLKTFNLEINEIPFETECLVAVHTFGNPVDIKAIRGAQSKIFIIEDCAHALFSQLRGKYLGNQGDAVLFSLYKQIANINGCLLLTKEKLIDSQKQERILPYSRRLLIKTDGFHQKILDVRKRQYLPKIEKQTLNDLLPPPLTFFLFEKGLPDLEAEIKKRRRIASWYYQEAEKSEDIFCQRPEPDSLSSYYHFVIRLKPELKNMRERAVRELRKNDIFVDRLWYQAPITQAKYKSFVKKCPQALLLAKTVINLPIYSNYTKSDVHELFQKLEQTIKDLMSH